MPSPSSSTTTARRRTPVVRAGGSTLTRTVALAVADGVLDQVGDDLGELVGVGHDLAAARRRRPARSAGWCRPATESTTRLDEHGGVGRARVELEPAGVDAGDVEQLGDQPAQPVGVGADRGEHQLLLVVVELVPPVQQRLHEALDPGQRRAQLVGDGGDQVGALAVEPGPAAAGAQADRDLLDRAVERAAGGCRAATSTSVPSGSSHDCSGTPVRVAQPVVGPVGRAPVRCRPGPAARAPRSSGRPTGVAGGDPSIRRGHGVDQR